MRPNGRSDSLDGAHQGAQRVLRVAEEHRRLRVIEQCVVDPCEARSHRPLQEDDLLGVVGVDDRHAVDRRARLVAGRRVDDVVGADDEDDVGLRDLPVDLVHLLELLVGHVRLRQQHVHVTRHPAGHRMDAVADVDTALFEQLRQLVDGVLCLRDRQAVPGYDDTRRAYASRIATSSTVPVRTDRSAPSAATTAVVGVAVMAPKRMFVSGRPIALLISCVSKVPDAPTSVPATMSSVVRSTAPLAATASPVNAFSSEMTTGTSAPPTGSTNSTPNTSATTSSSPAAAMLPVSPHTTRATAATPSPMFSNRCCGSTIGRPVISSCSLANVTADPVKETPPIRTLNSTAAAVPTPAVACERWNSASDTKAAAPPPTPLNAATICGMAVIFTARAAGIATAVPIAIPTTISQIRCRPGHAKVAPIATTMPAAPMRFPCRAHRGDDSPFSATMKQTAQNR